MQYPIFLHKDPDSDYGVIVPDLPGCFSAGSTVEEAIKNSREAIECHLENLDLKDAILAFVEIDIIHIFHASKKINISLPEKFLEQIDQYVKYYGGDRSSFLVNATINFIAEHHLQSN